MEEIKDDNWKKNIFRKILPIIFGIISILEYLYFPNYDKEMLATPVYLYFLISLLVLYGIFFIISFKNENLSENLAYKAPLFAFVFLLLTIYDLLTLKFAILPLPYFAWLDMIMNSMIADKESIYESDSKTNLESISGSSSSRFLLISVLAEVSMFSLFILSV